MNPPPETVLRTLRALRVRLLVQSFFEKATASAMGCVTVMLVAGTVSGFASARLPFDARLAAWLAIAALGVAIVWTFALVPSLAQVAAFADRRGATHDRFASALRLADSPDAMGTLAVRECAAFIESGDFHTLARITMPRRLPWIVAPLVALAMLEWHARIGQSARDAAREAGLAEAEKTARQLDHLARETEKRGSQLADEELRKIAEQLRKSAEQLRAQAADRDSAEKAALRELSALQDAIKELQKAGAAPSPQEIKELAKALAQHEQTRDAAKALEAGKLAEAAKAMEQAEKNLAQQGNEPAREQVEKSLREAMSHLAQQKQMSEAMRQLQQQLGADGGAQKLMQKLAEMLRQSANQPGGKSQQQQSGQGQKSGREMTMSELLSMIEGLKNGETMQFSQSNKPGEGDDGPRIAMDPFGKPSKQPGQQGEDGNPELPGGKSGSERDTGTTENPFGTQQINAGAKGTDIAARGRLGAGESLSLMHPSAGDKSKTTRRYKDLYEAMAPAAEEAVLQEEIPLGSRFFIKRYFESIRPRE